MATPANVLVSVTHEDSITLLMSLWFLFNPRINLSPFTKDFRGEEHYNESIDYFLRSCSCRTTKQIKCI